MREGAAPQAATFVVSGAVDSTLQLQEVTENLPVRASEMRVPPVRPSGRTSGSSWRSFLSLDKSAREEPSSPGAEAQAVHDDFEGGDESTARTGSALDLEIAS